MNYSLYTDLYELTMAQGYFLAGREKEEAIFDYFFRKLPFEGGYVVFAGLETLLDILEGYKFGSKEIAYLKRLGFKKEFLEYLKNFRFKGNVFSVKEGEVVFPNEPIVRIEGTLIETQLIETLLLNVLNFQSLVATKAARICSAAGEKVVLDFGMRRAQGLGAVWASRASVIGGVKATSNVFAAKEFGLTPSGTMAHSWVQSFGDELIAFRKYAEIYPDNAVLLLDTYNTLASGLPNAIKVAKELEAKGKRLLGVRLDSGDFAYLSREVRTKLNAAGLDYVKIAVSNQIDEYIIKSLEEQSAAIDIYGVGTKLAAAKPDGALDGVYKLSEIAGKATMKFSENIAKTTLPGRKEIRRFFSEDGSFYGDAVTLTNEKAISKYYHPHFSEKFKVVKGLRFENLLSLVFSKGKTTLPRISISEISDYAKNRLNLLPSEVRRFDFPHIYKVGVSKSIITLRGLLYTGNK